MKKIIALAILFSLNAKAQHHERACDVFSKINNVLQSRHFEPKPIDDSLSVYVFNTVIEQLDDNHILFLQEDYDKLALHKYKLDDYLKNKDCLFFDDFITIYQAALNRNKIIVEELTATNLPYTTADTIFYSKKAFPYNKKADKIKNFIRKRITFDILEDIAKLGKNKDSLKVLLPELGALSKSKITESYLCKINALLNPTEGFNNSMYNRFFSVFCNYFDPHSTYFNYSEKSSFISGISSENYSLGLYVSLNEKEEIIVEEIVPGGPAYKTYKIDKGDQILKLAANDIEHTVSCASMEAIIDIVFSDTYRDVELTMRKKDGTVYLVKLEKKVMKSEDHSVYSYILGDVNPIGYIKIPSFYSAFDHTSLKGCADDVAKEVLKLKKQNIQGLIIDLQYNGGGSMDEVISMAGMFINFGPITIIAGRNSYNNVIKDYNRGMLYDGPMVVLVNSFSASASEFFAGVMQDYNRAIIVGNTTMGKASMQTILPLDEEKKNTDFVKVTIDKFYRVTGKSSQYSGIVPDVPLPDFFEKFLPRESTLPTAMKNDTLDIKLKFKQMPDIALNKVIAMSKKRVAADTSFISIQSINKRIDALYEKDKTPLPITFDAVFDDVHAMDALWSEINLLANKENDLGINAPASDKTAILATDDFYKSINEYKINSLKTNLFVYEGVNVINDLINLKIQ
ncbi:peptidase S41 [Flavobacterium salilacus subsp. salilacus]|uniref:S41 family peptidase n=1 Tax=Flavobacterium TaxID=237 RepID=UPI001075498C|nr:MULTISPECIES: S41 family peptidase [Flavobacterium]KAF2519210.1 peptidase S41 [Flavobacterium salilacus subsp. salilacus]MBE1613390.1 PDZ domain-containing protein [Flavobacterium sp. SaA2.13]